MVCSQSYQSGMNGFCACLFFFFQAEDGIRDLVRSRGLGDVYKRQRQEAGEMTCSERRAETFIGLDVHKKQIVAAMLLLSLIHI